MVGSGQSYVSKVDFEFLKSIKTDAAGGIRNKCIEAECLGGFSGRLRQQRHLFQPAIGGLVPEFASRSNPGGLDLAAETAGKSSDLHSATHSRCLPNWLFEVFEVLSAPITHVCFTEIGQIELRLSTVLAA